jgi:DNA polymerase III alpha subunit (gram-positive type)
MAYLFLDNEMGGIGTQYSLLTVYLAVYDDNLQFVDELYLYLKPDDGIYKVCGEAMNVNRIDLKVHDTKAITYKEGGTALYNFLKKHGSAANRLVPVGHGIYGDIELIIHHLVSRGSWESFVSYRKLDTQAVCQFLKACGMFPETVSGSLESISNHFHIQVDEDKLHDAKYDTLLSVEVFKGLVNLIKPTQ